MRGREIIVWRTPRRLWELDPLSIPLLVTLDFEVFGDLRGMNFLQHCKNVGDRLGIRGWIRGTRYGSVAGQIQGEKDRVEELAIWVRHNGCPGSRIAFCEFRNWHVIDGFEYRKLNLRV